MTRVIESVPLGDDVFTDAALASMVGKTVPLTYGFDHDRHRLGDVTIVAAEQAPGLLMLTLDVDERTSDRIAEHIGSTVDNISVYDGPRGRERVPRHYGIGFTVGSARYEAPDHVKRIIAGMNLRVVSIVNTPPIAPSEDA